MTVPLLFIFSGLPGSGKTTLARELCRVKGCTYVRIDTLEQALKHAGCSLTSDEGYRAGYAIALENLKLGKSVVSDSCNPVEATRRAWINVAKHAGSNYVNIEVVCSNTDEHRARVERRVSDVPGLVLPTWEDVQDRSYDPWTMKRLLIDTAGKEPRESVEQLLAMLQMPAVSYAR